jgi:hypothetical protein
VVYMLEFLATNADGTRKTIEIIKQQRAKNVPLISERAETIMKDAVFQGERPDGLSLRSGLAAIAFARRARRR